ncbi:MAG: hypothetical protein HOQ24_04720 [Mycobacteriaceae bacterium]|nr:hypothetical protein [Mycobacteriaceae bacterium]
MPDLLFQPELSMRRARAKPLRKVLRALDAHLPGFFAPQPDLSGVEAGTASFAAGTFVATSAPATVHLHARSTGAPQVQADRIVLASGVCLFGYAGLHCVDSAGRRTLLEPPGAWPADTAGQIVAVRRGDRQVYPSEAVARLGRTISAVAQWANRHALPSECRILVPAAQYRLHAAALCARGRLTAAAYRRLCVLIDEEAAALSDQFTALCANFGIAAPSFDSNLPLDRDASERVAASASPQQIRRILTDSYVEGYRRAVAPGALPVFVDDISELPIYWNAQRTSGFRGIALYPLASCASVRAARLYFHGSATAHEIDRAVHTWWPRPAASTCPRTS